MTKTCISQYFENGIEEIFNPNIVYEGVYGFNSDVFSFVSKRENGRNLFDDYLDQTYYKYIKNVFSRMNFTSKPRLFFISDVDSEYGRNLKISASFLLSELCYNLVGDSPELPDDNSLLRGVLLDYFRNYKKAITRIANGEVNEEDKKIKETLDYNYISNETHRKNVLGNKYRPLSYINYLEAIKDNISTFLVGLRYIIPYLDKPINLEELESTLDLEKFYLAMVKQIIGVSEIAIESVGKIHNSFVYVEKYMMALKEFVLVLLNLTTLLTK